MKILRTILKVIIFIILVVLAINNMQSVEFNFLGIYNAHLPLIIILAIFAGGGFLIGILWGLINNLVIKSQLSNLKKQLANQQNRTTKSDDVI